MFFVNVSWFNISSKNCQEEARIINSSAKQAPDLVVYVMFMLTVSIWNINKKAPNIFWFQIQDFMISEFFLQNLKTQQMTN